MGDGCSFIAYDIMNAQRHASIVMVMVGTFLLLLASLVLVCCPWEFVGENGGRGRKRRERKKKAGEHWREIRIQIST